LKLATITQGPWRNGDITAPREIHDAVGTMEYKRPPLPPHLRFFVSLRLNDATSPNRAVCTTSHIDRSPFISRSRPIIAHARSISADARTIPARARTKIFRARTIISHAWHAIERARPSISRARTTILRARRPIARARPPIVRAWSSIAHARSSIAHAWRPIARTQTSHSVTLPRLRRTRARQPHSRLLRTQR
jgi:hypothetical protein